MAFLLRHGLRPTVGRLFFSSQPFSLPPNASRRRVVVTGLGMVTPLGCWVERSWSRLVDGQRRIRALVPADLKMDDFDEATVMHTYELCGFPSLDALINTTVPNAAPLPHPQWPLVQCRSVELVH